MVVKYPKAFIHAIEDSLGDESGAFFLAMADTPPVSIRKNPRKNVAVFEGECQVPWNKLGFYLPERPAFFADPLLHGGAYYVQEASSMLPGALVEPVSEMKVLDLCAAPGGKSTMLRALLPDNALVVSNELVFERSLVLVENMSRWGYSNVIVTQGEAERFLRIPNHFDIVLLDAPCSGEGMFRKDPDAVAHWSAKLVTHSAEIQLGLLEVALTCVKPGGMVLFSTCTFNHIENEGVLETLAERYPGAFSIEPIAFPSEWGLKPGIRTAACTDTRHTLHAYPHCCKGEGFFLAKLVKHDFPSKFTGNVKVPQPALQFLKAGEPTPPTDWLTPLEWQWGKDNHGTVVAWPAWMEAELRMLNRTHTIIKAGVRVGAGVKGGWIPDQELAWSVDIGMGLPSVELSHSEALRYMKREAPIAAALSQGWHLATHCGIGLGWLKGVGNRWNVHLPKALKIRNNVDAWL